MSSQHLPEPVREYAFWKYHGAGNDFVMIDNRLKSFPVSDVELITAMCRRRFGIGADGLICIETDTDAAFYMRYFNADGRPGSFCGNGARCAVLFASHLGFSESPILSFRAFDGIHRAELDQHGNRVSIEMHVREKPRPALNGFFADTGSPHFILYVDDLEGADVHTEGNRIRQHEMFSPGGVNVNFVSVNEQGLSIRTFERGVEAETLACGTGVVASALVAREAGWWKLSPVVPVLARGGILHVDTSQNNPMLTGEAIRVYSGLWSQV